MKIDLQDITPFGASIIVPLEYATDEFERRLPLMFVLLFGMEEIEFYSTETDDGRLRVYSIAFPPTWDVGQIPGPIFDSH